MGYALTWDKDQTRGRHYPILPDRIAARMPNQWQPSIWGTRSSFAYGAGFRNVSSMPRSRVRPCLPAYTVPLEDGYARNAEIKSGCSPEKD